MALQVAREVCALWIDFEPCAARVSERDSSERRGDALRAPFGWNEGMRKRYDTFRDLIGRDGVVAFALNLELSIDGVVGDLLFPIHGGGLLCPHTL